MSDLLNKASLVMVPSGYKEDTVYSVIPTDGSGDLAFTRASNGTRVNSAGLVEVCPWNLVQYSEQFNVSPWQSYNQGTGVLPVIKANDTTAPNGTTTADKVVFNTGSGTSASDISTIYQTLSSQAEGVYTASIYAKVASGTAKILLRHAGGGTYTTLNLTTEWQRFEVAETLVGSTSFSFEIGLRRGLSNEPLTSPVTCYLWGAQVNIGSTAKPYFPTTDRLNVPRLTYQNGGGGCPSLLLEKQSTNVVKYSQDFMQSDWQKSGATITANAIISPDGTQNATRVQFSAGSRYLYQSLTGVAAGSVTISCYIKGASVQNIGFSDGNANPNQITLTTDWQRYTFTFNYSGGGIGIQFDNYFGVMPNQEPKDFYIWGAQLEASSYATSYIPTTSSSATRVADECYKTGISSLIGQTEGVLFVDFVFTAYDGSSKWIAFLGGGTEYIGIYAGAGNEIFGEIYNLGTQAIITFNSFVVGTRYKMALAYKANDFAFYVNGVQIGTDSSGTVPTIANFNFNYNTTNDRLGGKFYNEVALFKTRLTNAELASLTTL